MVYENLLYEKKDGIAWITFNRPKVLNALNRKTIEEFQRIGLVNHIYEPAELLSAAEALGEKIIEKAPLAVKYCMEAIERGVEMPQEEGLFLEATLFGLCCATEDMREGTKAFLEKRSAVFKGK